MHPTAKVSEGTNRNMPARNILDILALYTNPESQNAQIHRQTDRQTDDRITPIADHTVRSANKKAGLSQR